MKKSKIIIIMIGILVVGGSLLILNIQTRQGDEHGGNTVSIGQKVTVYKSPTCGCCVKHAAYLEDHGYDVEVIKERNMSIIKSRYNIPEEMESCHTSVFGDYIVEGHIPIEAIEKLLAEKPDIDGIALPDMPSGSPGMPGVKRGPFTIYALTNGEITEFTTL